MFRTKIGIPILQMTVEVLARKNTEQIKKKNLINFVTTHKKKK